MKENIKNWCGRYFGEWG